MRIIKKNNDISFLSIVLENNCRNLPATPTVTGVTVDRFGRFCEYCSCKTMKNLESPVKGEVKSTIDSWKETLKVNPRLDPRAIFAISAGFMLAASGEDLTLRFLMA